MRKIIATFIFLVGLSFIFAQPMMNNTNRPVCPNRPMMDNCDIAFGSDKGSTSDRSDKPFGPGWMEKEPKEMMESIRMWRMTEALDLSSDQSAKLFPKLKDMRQLREDFENTRMSIINDITYLLHQDNPADKDLRYKLDTLQTADDNFHKQEAKLQKDIASILTIKQQAKLVLFQLKFDEEMRQIIGKVREHHQGAEQKPHPRWQFWRQWQ
jgi:Spy/CpxP family protein refolding chaperone